MSEIIIKKDEPFESALRRFKKKIDKEGILRELRDRKHYEKAQRTQEKKSQEDKIMHCQINYCRLHSALKGGVGETVPPRLGVLSGADDKSA